MKSIEANKQLIAACGLYCGACRKYISEKCPGCHENEKATWCKIRSCAIGNGSAPVPNVRRMLESAKYIPTLSGRYSHFYLSLTARPVSDTYASMEKKLSPRK